MRDVKFRAWSEVNGRFLRQPFYIGCEGVTYKDSDPNGVDMSGKRRIYPNKLIVNQYTGLKDKNGKEIYEGDIVEGYMGWMKGDGRLKKGYPDKIRYWFEIFYSDGKFGECGWELKEISVHPEDDFARAEYFYRSILYSLEESRECELKDNEIQWKGVCESLEVIGNIYENKNLL